MAGDSTVSIAWFFTSAHWKRIEVRATAALTALGIGNFSRQGAKSPSLEGNDKNSYE